MEESLHKWWRMRVIWQGENNILKDIKFRKKMSRTWKKGSLEQEKELHLNFPAHIVGEKDNRKKRVRERNSSERNVWCWHWKKHSEILWALEVIGKNLACAKISIVYVAHCFQLVIIIPILPNDDVLRTFFPSYSLFIIVARCVCHKETGTRERTFFCVHYLISHQELKYLKNLK